jgi:hypothetical protein
MQQACLKASLITLLATMLNTRLASTSLTPSATRKCSCMQKRIKFVCQSKKQLKFETYLLNLPRTSSTWHPRRSLGQHTVWVPSGSMSMQPLFGRPQEPCWGTTTNKRYLAPCWHKYGVPGHSSWCTPTASCQLDASPSCPPSFEQVEIGESVAIWKIELVTSYKNASKYN